MVERVRERRKHLAAVYRRYYASARRRARGVGASRAAPALMRRARGEHLA